jgi:hypothetical protein
MATNTIRLHRVLRAPPERVYRALSHEPPFPHTHFRDGVPSVYLLLPSVSKCFIRSLPYHDSTSLGNPPG